MDWELLTACMLGNLDDVRILLYNPKINVNAKHEDHLGQTPLIFAILYGHYEIVELLLHDSRIDVNLGDKDGSTPLHFACLYEKIGVLKLLLKQEKLDINKSNNDDVTPLMNACIDSHVDVVQLLLANTKDIHLTPKNSYGKTAIDLAREKGLFHILELLEAYEKDPKETRVQLRKKLGLCGNLTFYFIFFNYYNYLI